MAATTPASVDLGLEEDSENESQLSRETPRLESPSFGGTAQDAGRNQTEEDVLEGAPRLVTAGDVNPAEGEGEEEEEEDHRRTTPERPRDANDFMDVKLAAAAMDETSSDSGGGDDDDEDDSDGDGNADAHRRRQAGPTQRMQKGGQAIPGGQTATVMPLSLADLSGEAVSAESARAVAAAMSARLERSRADRVDLLPLATCPELDHLRDTAVWPRVLQALRPTKEVQYILLRERHRRYREEGRNELRGVRYRLVKDGQEDTGFLEAVFRRGKRTAMEGGSIANVWCEISICGKTEGDRTVICSLVRRSLFDRKGRSIGIEVALGNLRRSSTTKDTQSTEGAGDGSGDGDGVDSAGSTTGPDQRGGKEAEEAEEEEQEKDGDAGVPQQCKQRPTDEPVPDEAGPDQSTEPENILASMYLQAAVDAPRATLAFVPVQHADEIHAVGGGSVVPVWKGPMLGFVAGDLATATNAGESSGTTPGLSTTPGTGGARHLQPAQQASKLVSVSTLPRRIVFTRNAECVLGDAAEASPGAASLIAAVGSAAQTWTLPVRSMGRYAVSIKNCAIETVERVAPPPPPGTKAPQFHGPRALQGTSSNNKEGEEGNAASSSSANEDEEDVCLAGARCLELLRSAYGKNTFFVRAKAPLSPVVAFAIACVNVHCRLRGAKVAIRGTAKDALLTHTAAATTDQASVSKIHPLLLSAVQSKLTPRTPASPHAAFGGRQGDARSIARTLSLGSPPRALPTWSDIVLVADAGWTALIRSEMHHWVGLLAVFLAMCAEMSPRAPRYNVFLALALWLVQVAPWVPAASFSLVAGITTSVSLSIVLDLVWISVTAPTYQRQTTSSEPAYSRSVAATTVMLFGLVVCKIGLTERFFQRSPSGLVMRKLILRRASLFVPIPLLPCRMSASAESHRRLTRNVQQRLIALQWLQLVVAAALLTVSMIGASQPESASIFGTPSLANGGLALLPIFVVKALLALLVALILFLDTDAFAVVALFGCMAPCFAMVKRHESKRRRAYGGWAPVVSVNPVNLRRAAMAKVSEVFVGIFGWIVVCTALATTSSGARTDQLELLYVSLAVLILTDVWVPTLSVCVFILLRRYERRRRRDAAAAEDSDNSELEDLGFRPRSASAAAHAHALRRKDREGRGGNSDQYWDDDDESEDDGESGARRELDDSRVGLYVPSSSSESSSSGYGSSSSGSSDGSSTSDDYDSSDVGTSDDTTSSSSGSSAYTDDEEGSETAADDDDPNVLTPADYHPSSSHRSRGRSTRRRHRSSHRSHRRSARNSRRKNRSSHGSGRRSGRRHSHHQSRSRHRSRSRSRSHRRHHRHNRGSSRRSTSYRTPASAHRTPASAAAAPPTSAVSAISAAVSALFGSGGTNSAPGAARQSRSRQASDTRSARRRQHAQSLRESMQYSMDELFHGTSPERTQRGRGRGHRRTWKDEEAGSSDESELEQQLTPLRRTEDASDESGMHKGDAAVRALKVNEGDFSEEDNDDGEEGEGDEEPRTPASSGYMVPPKTAPPRRAIEFSRSQRQSRNAASTPGKRRRQRDYAQVPGDAEDDPLGREPMATPPRHRDLDSAQPHSPFDDGQDERKFAESIPRTPPPRLFSSEASPLHSRSVRKRRSKRNDRYVYLPGASRHDSHAFALDRLVLLEASRFLVLWDQWPAVAEFRSPIRDAPRLSDLSSHLERQGWLLMATGIVDAVTKVYACAKAVLPTSLADPSSEHKSEANNVEEEGETGRRDTAWVLMELIVMWEETGASGEPVEARPVACITVKTDRPEHTQQFVQFLRLGDVMDVVAEPE